MSTVAAFGKVPSRSVRIPLPHGGTTSPDFMFFVKSDEGDRTAYIVIETKDVEEDSSLREEEILRIEAMSEFSESLRREGVPVRFREQKAGDPVAALITEALQER